MLWLTGSLPLKQILHFIFYQVTSTSLSQHCDVSVHVDCKRALVVFAYESDCTKEPGLRSLGDHDIKEKKLNALNIR